MSSKRQRGYLAAVIKKDENQVSAPRQEKVSKLPSVCFEIRREVISLVSIRTVMLTVREKSEYVIFRNQRESRTFLEKTEHQDVLVLCL